MPTFDASGGNTAVGASSVTWTQAISAAGQPVLFVLGSVGVQPDGGITSSATALKGGVATAMTPIGSPVHTNGGTAGFTQLFGMINPDTGTNTIVFSCSVSTACLTGVSESWTAADQVTGWNAITPAVGSSATAAVTATIAATSGISAFACAGSAFSGTMTGGTFRRNQTGNGSSGAGNSIGGTATGTGSALTMSFPISGTDFWAALAVEVLPAGGSPSAPATGRARPGRAWLRRYTRRFRTPEAEPAPGAPSGTPYIAGLQQAAGGGYFVDQYGAPRLVLGDAVWGLPGNAGRWSSGAWQSDFDTYTATRGGQGYTVAYTKPMGTTQNAGINDDGRTFDGLFPFQGGTLANPSTGLTAAYWARFDYFLASCQAQGITVFCNAIGYDSDFETSGPLAGKSAAEFQAYGQLLGTRYAAQRNLVWLVADDYFGGATDAKITAFLTGLRAAGATQPITIENYPETTSRKDLSSGSATVWGAANAQFQFTYSYNVTYYGIEQAYAEPYPLPVIQGDGYFHQGNATYAGGSGAFAFDRATRQDAWHALSSGARGIIHGDEGCWQWASTAQAQAAASWYHVHNAGNIRALIESLPGWHRLLPDAGSQLVTSGRGTHATGFTSGGGGGQYETAFTDSYVSASRTPAGDLAVIYLSHAATIGIDQSQMVAGYQAFWVDPITGAKTATTAGSSYNSATPGNNSQGDPDWVLVLQAATGSSQAGAASLAGVGSLTAGPRLAASSSLSGQGTLAASPQQAATAGLSGVGTLAAAPVAGASAALSGQGTLTPGGVTTGVTAGLSGQGTLGAAPRLAGAASLSGLGTLSAGGALAAAASLSGLGTLTAGPAQILPATAGLSGLGTLSAAAQLAGAAGLSGQGTLSAAWALRVIAGLSGVGTLAFAQGQVTAGLSGTGSLTAGPQLRGTAGLSGTGTLAAGPVLRLPGTAGMAGVGTLGASAALLLAVAAGLSGRGTLTAVPTVTAPHAPGVLVGLWAGRPYGRMVALPPYEAGRAAATAAGRMVALPPDR